MRSLDGVTTGCFLVTTASGSAYEIDLDNHTLARRPAAEADESVPLRRDLDRVTLLAVETCQIGERAVFLIDLRLRGVEFTARRTTAVRRIDALGTGLDDAVINAEFQDLLTDWGDVTPGGAD